MQSTVRIAHKSPAKVNASFSARVSITMDQRIPAQGLATADTQLVALLVPRRRQRLKQFIKLERAGLASGQDRLSDLRCDHGKPQNSVKVRVMTCSALANSAEEVYLPLSIIWRQRWARTHGLDQGAIDARCW